MSLAESMAPTSSIESLSAAALDAALELDRLIRSENADLGPITRFAEELTSFVNSAKANVQNNIPINTTPLLALSTAIEGQGKPEPRTIEQVLGKISELSVNLSNPRSIPELSEQLLSFCLNLHHELLSCRGGDDENWEVDDLNYVA